MYKWRNLTEESKFDIFIFSVQIVDVNRVIEFQSMERRESSPSVSWIPWLPFRDMTESHSHTVTASVWRLYNKEGEREGESRERFVIFFFHFRILLPLWRSSDPAVNEMWDSQAEPSKHWRCRTNSEQRKDCCYLFGKFHPSKSPVPQCQGNMADICI